MLTLEQMASALTAAALASRDAKPEMEHVGQLVEDTAKEVIGTYDLGWAPLAASTIAQKANGDTPLLESGAMRDSIGHITESRSVSIGSNDQDAVWQELGTAKIPARSFLQGSALHSKDKILSIIGEATMKRLSPK